MTHPALPRPCFPSLPSPFPSQPPPVFPSRPFPSPPFSPLSPHPRLACSPCARSQPCDAHRCPATHLRALLAVSFILHFLWHEPVWPRMHPWPAYCCCFLHAVQASVARHTAFMLLPLSLPAHESACHRAATAREHRPLWPHTHAQPSCCCRCLCTIAQASVASHTCSTRMMLPPCGTSLCGLTHMHSSHAAVAVAGAASTQDHRPLWPRMHAPLACCCLHVARATVASHMHSPHAAVVVAASARDHKPPWPRMHANTRLQLVPACSTSLCGLSHTHSPHAVVVVAASTQEHQPLWPRMHAPLAPCCCLRAAQSCVTSLTRTVLMLLSLWLSPH